MSVYGSKLYGTFTYGVGATTDISVYPFTATSLDYGTIDLSWVYPTSVTAITDVGSLPSFLILRSAAGFPVTPDGGDLIFKSTKTQLSSLVGTTGTLTDSGSFYDPLTGSSTPTYTATVTGATDDSIYVTLVTSNSNIKVGQKVTYTPSGSLTGANAGKGIIGNTTVAAISGTKITLSKAATIPDGTTLNFTPTFLTPGKTYYYSAFVLANNYWQRVGTAIGTAIKDYNTANIMYGMLPQVYRTGIPSSSSTSVNKNTDLYNFLRVIGVQYDFIKTKIENAKNRYDVTNLDGRLLPAMMDQMGFSYESGLGLQQSRRLLNNFDFIALNKGTAQGIKKFITSFTGYPVTIASVKNLFLTLDCSSFEAGSGFWESSGASATITNTTSALEGGNPIPYAVSSSPDGYANSQLGYLKVEAKVTTSATNPIELTYGASMDNAAIGSSNTVTIPAQTPSGTTVIKIATSSAHGLTAGKTIKISGVTPSGYNGTWVTQPGTANSHLILNLGSNPGKITVAGKVFAVGVTSGSNNSDSGYQYVSLTTGDVEHGFSVGQYVVVGGMSPATQSGNPAVNGIWEIVAVPDVNTFTYYNPNLTADISSQIVSIDTAGSVSLYDPTNCGIPVTAGLAYTFSIYSQANSTTSQWKLGIRWYDKYGTLLWNDFATTGVSNNLNTWRQLSIANKTAPSYAYYAVPYIRNSTTVSNGNIHYFDGAQFEQSSSVTTYADARRVDFYLGASRINQVINPGFELATAGWTTTGTVTTTGFVTDTSNVYPTSSVGLGTAVSTKSAKLTSNTAATTLYPTNTISVSANTAYAFSAYIKGPDTDTVTLSITWKNAGGTTLSTSSSSVTALSTSFSRVSLIANAPATAATASLLFTFAGTSGDIYYVDSILFESSGTVNAYFDGNTGYNISDDLLWEQNAAGTAGTASTGRSLYYPNKSLTKARLNDALNDYLPIGTSWSVFIGTTAT
jgi:hypothetical protein